MSAQVSQVGERVRSAELVAALCLATDLGMGFPFEHGLHTTLIAMRLGERLGIDRASASQTYYACLLSHAGCTADAHVGAEVFGGSLTTHLNPVMYGSRRDVLSGLVRGLPRSGSEGPARAVEVVRRLPRMVREQRVHLTATCEVAQMLGDRVGGPPSVRPLLAHLLERWDGKGPLGRAKGDEIPLPMRIVAVAVDASFQRLRARLTRMIEQRAMPKVSVLVPVFEPGPLIEPLIASLLFQTMPAADDPAALIFPRVKGRVRIDPGDAAGGAALRPGRYDVLVTTAIAGFAAETAARVGDTSFTITVSPDGRVTPSQRVGDAVRHASRRDRLKARIAHAVRGRGHT